MEMTFGTIEMISKEIFPGNLEITGETDVGPRVSDLGFVLVSLGTHKEDYQGIW